VPGNSMDAELQEKIKKIAQDLGVAAMVPNQEISCGFDAAEELQGVSWLLVEVLRQAHEFNEARSLIVEQSVELGDFTSDIELLNGSVIHLRLTSVGMMDLASGIEKNFGDKKMGKIAGAEWRRKAQMKLIVSQKTTN